MSYENDPDFPVVHLDPDPEPAAESSPGARDAARRAAGAVGDGARAAAIFVVRGPLLLSLLCMIGGGLVAGSGIYRLITLNPLQARVEYLLYIYYVIFGVFAMFLEFEPNHCRNCKCCKDCVPGCIRFRSHLLDYTQFATAPFGRGAYYLFVGSLGVIEWDWFPSAAGFYMIACGGLLMFAQCFTKPEPVADA